MIDKKIEEIERYFIDKIVNKEYKIVDDYYTYSVYILIDEKYYFNIWTSNGIKNVHVHLGNSLMPSFMRLIFNDGEKEKIYDDFVGKRKKDKLEIEIKEMEKKINESKETLKQL